MTRTGNQDLVYTLAMTKIEIQRQVLKLPEDDRLEIAEAIWASLDRASDSVPLPQWQRELLDERLASAEHEEGRDWEEIREEIWPSVR